MSPARRPSSDAAPAAFARAWRAARLPRPVVGLVFGSGLASLADRIRSVKAFDPTRIRGYPRPTVPGHRPRIVSGTLSGVPVAAFLGRIHAYEGHPPAVVALPARFLCALDVRALVLTNAAGTLRKGWRPGDAMLIRDHLNLLGGSPLEGPVDRSGARRFVDMSDAWPEELRALARRTAPRGLAVREGVYAACRGPQYETPAEVTMLRKLGADAVGMSTVHEAIAAAAERTPVFGLSLLTNYAAGVGAATLDHADVLEVAKRACARLADWFEDLVPLIAAAAERGRRESQPR